jgi:hypothetical protein
MRTTKQESTDLSRTTLRNYEIEYKKQDYKWYIMVDGVTVQAHFSLNDAKKGLWKMKGTTNLSGRRSGNVPSFSKPQWLTGKRQTLGNVRYSTK